MLTRWTDGYVARRQAGLGWLILISSITGFKAHHFQEIFADCNPQLRAESYEFRSQRTVCSDPRSPLYFPRFTEQALELQLGKRRDQWPEPGEGEKGRLKLSGRKRRRRAQGPEAFGVDKPSCLFAQHRVQVSGAAAGPASHCFSDIRTLPTPACGLSHVLLVGCVPHAHCVSLPRFR